MGECETLLKRLIEEKYGNVHTFAIQAGIPDSSIRSALTRGFANISITLGLKICNALNCDIESLLQGEYTIKKAAPKSPVISEIVCYANSMNEEGMLALRVQARYLSEQQEYKDGEDGCDFLGA